MFEYDSKLIKLVVDDTPKAIFGLIVVSLIFIWVYIDYIPSEYLYLWSLAQIVFIFTRYMNSRMLLKFIEEDNPNKLKLHTVFFGLIILFAAIIWSTGTILGAIYAPTPYAFVSLIIIMGIVTATVLSLTPIFNVFLSYFFIMIFTQLGIMLYFGNHSNLAIVAFLLVYMPVIILLSKSVYNHHLSSIKIQDSLKAHNAELRELSITDSLTKVYNRRHFFEAAQTLISISKRENSDVSFLMIDIDHFKDVNDTYGHQVGDYILVMVAQEIQAITRDSDIFARIGGEEFALVLHNTSKKGSKIIAEKIRKAIEMTDFKDNYISIDVTVSIGLSTLNETIRTLEELYQDADKKLYVAKQLGRNRIQ